MNVGLGANIFNKEGNESGNVSDNTTTDIPSSVFPQLKIRRDVVEIPFPMLEKSPRIPIVFPTILAADNEIAKK